MNMDFVLLASTAVSALITIAAVCFSWFRVRQIAKRAAAIAARDSMPPKESLPDIRKSVTIRRVIGGRKIYLTCGDYEDGRLGEIFIEIDKCGSEVRGLSACFAIAVSVALQHGISLAHLIDKFSFQDFEPNGGTNDAELPMVKSIIDYIFRRLQMDYDENGRRIKKKRGKK